MSEQIVKRRPMIDLEEFERRLRQPLAAHQRDDDPLAELARSFGGAEEDPYKTVFEPLNRRPAGAWRSEDRADSKTQGARAPLIGGDFAAIEAGLLGDDAHTESLSASEDTAGYALNGQERWPYEDAENSHVADAAYEEVRSRRPLYVMAAMIIAGIAGIGASFAFKGAATNQNEIATIRAADGPAKIHPETVASTEVTDRDASVLGGVQQQPPVAAINNVEQPADLSAQHDLAPLVQSDSSAGLASGAASVPVPPPPSQVQTQPSPEPATIAGLIEPKKVKTVSVRPDGTLLPNDTPPQAAAPLKPVARPIAASPAKAATPKSTARVATTPKPADSLAAKAKRVQVADAQGQAPVAEATHVAAGTFAVQLAAPGTEQEARDVQVRLMKKFSGELAGFHPSIHKAVLGDKTVYRVRVSGLSSRDEATALCQKVQSGGGNCFVAKN
jgi:hypothetical protein